MLQRFFFGVENGEKVIKRCAARGCQDVNGFGMCLKRAGDVCFSGRTSQNLSNITVVFIRFYFHYLSFYGPKKVLVQVCENFWKDSSVKTFITVCCFGWSCAQYWSFEINHFLHRKALIVLRPLWRHMTELRAGTQKKCCSLEKKSAAKHTYVRRDEPHNRIESKICWTRSFCWSRLISLLF